MRKNLLFLFILIPAFLVNAQIPSGYYDGTQGLTSGQLKSTLHNIIKGHTELEYDALKELIKLTDQDPNNSDNIILIYTGRSQAKNTFGTNPDDWNREHVWAKSHGDFGETKPCGTDLHHIRPADASVNSDRGNKDFDNGGTPHSEATGCNYDDDSWEPRDEVKGDIARMMFYMAVRYEGTDGEPDLEIVDYTGTEGTPTFGKLSALIEWNTQDPVDNFERNRNEIIFQYQQNRNPFIDHHEFIDSIWGQGANISSKVKQKISFSVYPNPVKDVFFFSAPQLLNEKISIIIFDAIGSPIKSYDNFNVSRKNSVNVGDLVVGAYFVKFICGEFSRVERIVIDK